jgi:outer membrane receptor protein involved in Fe transport
MDMKTLNINLVLILVSFFSISAVAQNNLNSSISGSIIDDQQKVLDYVAVTLIKAEDSSLVKSTLSDDLGKFSFDDVKTGKYLVKAQLVGYAEGSGSELTVSSGSSKLDAGSIVLKPVSKSLKEVVVSAKKPFIERKIDRLVVNVESSSISTGSTALEVLQKSPGVTVDQNNNIAMQGKQGVLMMLDGKQTYMSNEDLVNLLRNMQSSEIESIELITNPSSKYDVSGNSGIINIKTKKGRGYGTNGSINAGIGKSENYRNNAGINLNHRNKSFNIFGNYNYSKYQNDQILDIKRISTNGSENDYFNQETNNYYNNNNNSYKLGSDFFINKNNTIGFLINGYSNSSEDNNTSGTYIGKSFAQPDSFILVNGYGKNSYQNMAYNLNYKLVIDTLGQEISTDLDYSHFIGKQKANYDNFFQDLQGNISSPPLFFRNNSPSNIDVASFKVDYVKPFKNEVKMEAGIKTSWVKTDNDFQYSVLNNNSNIWENDPRRSNHFVFEENINAAYINLNKQFKKTSVQLGLRAEQTHSKGNLITTQKEVKRSYLNLFPSVFINQPLSDNHNISVSYSRRIDRPNYNSLNPFEYYLDQYTYNKGNPFLNPQFTNKYEVNYTYKSKYNLSLGSSITNDAITEVILPDTAKKALYQTRENLDKQLNYYLNLNVPVTYAKWWSGNNNLTVFYLGFRANDLKGEKLKSGKVVAQINSQHNFVITKTLNAEYSFNYTSPLEYGTLILKSQYGMDAGLSKNLLDNKVNIKFSVSDIFNTYRQTITSTYEGLDYDLYQKNESRWFKLNISYKFGKNEIKPARRRSTGLETEQSRMQN